MGLHLRRSVAGVKRAVLSPTWDTPSERVAPYLATVRLLGRFEGFLMLADGWPTCESCDGTGDRATLFPPYETTHEPCPSCSGLGMVPPQGCPVTVWDGPYKMRCGLGAEVSECAYHGPFDRESLLAVARKEQNHE